MWLTMQGFHSPLLTEPEAMDTSERVVGGDGGDGGDGGTAREALMTKRAARRKRKANAMR